MSNRICRNAFQQSSLPVQTRFNNSLLSRKHVQQFPPLVQTRFNNSFSPRKRVSTIVPVAQDARQTHNFLGIQTKLHNSFRHGQRNPWVGENIGRKTHDPVIVAFKQLLDSCVRVTLCPDRVRFPCRTRTDKSGTNNLFAPRPTTLRARKHHCSLGGHRSAERLDFGPGSQQLLMRVFSAQPIQGIVSHHPSASCFYAQRIVIAVLPTGA